MEQSALKFLRLLIPGMIIVIITYFFIQISTDKELSDLKFGEYSTPLILALISGAFYLTFNIRYIVTNFTHKQIDLNIKKNIFNLYPGNLTPTQTQYLYDRNRLKNVFYKIVDGDPSLVAKGKNVYFNGLLWSSFADAFILCIFSSSIILIFTFFSSVKTTELRLFCFTLLVSAILSLCLHILSFFNHVKISNDQIEFIETNHITEVKIRIDKTLNDNNVL